MSRVLGYRLSSFHGGVGDNLLSVFLCFSHKLAGGHVKVMVTITRKDIYRSEGQITWVWLLNLILPHTGTVRLKEEEQNEE